MLIKSKLLLGLIAPPIISAGNYSPYGNLCRDLPYTSSADVINNLASFSTFYVSYGNCAYSIQTNGEENRGGGGDEGWYQGFQFSRGANVAYSLYGSKSAFGGCSKSTFINSFYTLDGLYSFAQSVGLSLGDIYTHGYYQQQGGGENNQENGGGCTSALICGEDKKHPNTFIQASFTDGMCHLNGYSETTDTLSSLNSALSKQSCVKISSDSLTTLLTYSQTCTALSGAQCPDPHGLLAACAVSNSEFDKYIANGGKDHSKPYRYVFGTFFYLIAFGIAGYTILLMKKQQMGDNDSYKTYDSQQDDQNLGQPYAPSRTLSIQSVAHSVAASVKEMAHTVKDAVYGSAQDDRMEPLETTSGEAASTKPKKKGPFALLRRGRNKK